ncbi:MAG: rod shape-determining protein MreC [Clostridia bacterium]|nr:rod shape-determining protein MreC [Clostridia bacterium]
MKQFFKNRFFYIMTVLTLLLTIVPMVYHSMGVTFIFRDIVNVMMTPMQKLFHAAGDAVDGFAAYFYKFDDLVEENMALKEEVASLQAQIYDNKEMEEMYAWMSDFLDMKRQHTDYQMTAATVTGRGGGTYSSVLTLDTGSGAGITVGMPVVTADGVVGQITEVGYNWSRVTTILEAQSAVGVYVERTGESGVAEGDIQLTEDGLVKIQYLADDTAVQPGDRVLTSGFGVYPRGLVVGYIQSLETNPYTRTQTAYVQCMAPVTDGGDVMIITDFMLYAE